MRYVGEKFVMPRNTDEGYAALIDAWEANNAKIIAWINNFVKHSLSTQLAKNEKTKKV